MSVETQELELTAIDDGTTNEYSSRVILFNDNWHSFDEVIDQLIKAISCSMEQAEEFAWEVHNKGKAAVYEGEMAECLKVSEVLEEIALHTQIEC